ncbi:MAG: carbohydrate binding domain-containing protein [Marmoricola sp.]
MLNRLLHPSRRSRLVACLVSAAAVCVVTAGPAMADLPDTPYPQLQLDHVMHTSPFQGSNVSMRDNEGSAYVPQDQALWLADDDGRMLYEVDPFTGTLERTIGQDVLSTVRKYGGGPQAGTWRVRDLESLAYDAHTDTLYAFSGKCCTTSELPTVFRLTRDKHGNFQPDSYQALPAGSDFTAAAWNPGDGNVYVGVNHDLQTYTYATNTPGPVIQVPGLYNILGMEFSSDGAHLYVVHSHTQLARVDWSTKTLSAGGWSWDLSSFGIADARAVVLIDDKFWVCDGYDFRPAGDPLAHAVYVFDVTPAPPGYNIVGNPGFEQNTDGWNPNHDPAVTLERVPGGHSGSWAARLSNTGTSPTTLTLNDHPNWVDVTAAGTYTVTAWVRSDTGQGNAFLRMREYQGATKVATTQASVPLTPSWQQLTIQVVPTAPGTSSLDMDVYAFAAPAGTNLYIDDVAINYTP